MSKGEIALWIWRASILGCLIWIGMTLDELTWLIPSGEYDTELRSIAHDVEKILQRMR